MACNVPFVNQGHDLKSSSLHRQCPTVLENSGNFGVFGKMVETQVHASRTFLAIFEILILDTVDISKEL